MTPLLLCFLAQIPAAWTPDLSMQVQRVSAVTPSPDGRWVAYTQTRPVMEAERSEAITHIFLARADGSARAQLTRGEKSATQPAFSADSRFVLFLSERSGKPNLWRIPVDGGEAEALTAWKGEISAFRVSPDGRTVAFTALEERADDEKHKKEKLDYRVIDENPRSHGLWLVPFEAGQQGQRVPRKLAAPASHIGAFDWSPDSRHIAFSHTPSPLADNWTQADISEVDVEGGAIRPLAVTAAAEDTPRYSPDGRYLAYSRSSEPVR
ncbi:MAG: TolB family protein, partial [Bryobacteraceae bacterium]